MVSIKHDTNLENLFTHLRKFIRFIDCKLGFREKTTEVGLFFGRDWLNDLRVNRVYDQAPVYE